MKAFTIFVMLTFLGCNAVTEPQVPEDAGTPADKLSGRYAYPDDLPRTESSDGPCGRTETIVIHFDGGSRLFTVALPCNPRWRNTGDPAP